MKYEMEKRLRVLLTVISGLVIGIGIIMLIVTLRTKEVRQETVLYEYNVVPIQEYQVVLKNNPYIQDKVVPSGKSYLHNLVSEIQMKLGFDFVADKESELSGNYEIIARVQGYQMQEGTQEVIWYRDTILEQGRYDNSGSSQSIIEPVNINLNTYESMVEGADEYLGIGLNSQLLIIYTGEFDVTSEAGDKHFPVETSLIIPLNENLFTISAPTSEPMQDIISTVSMVKPELSVMRLIVAIFLMAAGVAGILCVLLGTKNMEADTRHRKALRRIIRNYASRFVPLQEMPERDISNVYRVKDAEALIKLADELRQPVFYVVSEENLPKGSDFFLYDGTKEYRFHLEEKVDESSMPKYQQSCPQV